MKRDFLAGAFVLYTFLAVAQPFEVERTMTAGAGVETIVYSPVDNSLLSGDFSGTITWLDVSTGAVIRRLKAHQKSIEQIAFSADAKMMCTCSEDGTAKVWDLATLRLISTFATSSIHYDNTYNAINSCAFSPDGRYLLMGQSDGSVFKCQVGGSSRPQLIMKYEYAITDGITSPDRRHYIFSSGFSIYFFNFMSGKIDKELSDVTPGSYVNNLAVTPTNRNLLASWCQNGTIRFWDISRDVILATVKSGDQDYSHVNFSPSGKYLLSGTSGVSAKIWDVATHTLVTVLSGHTDRVRDVRFTPDEKHVVTCSDDGTVALWKPVVPVVPEKPKPEQVVKKDSVTQKAEVHFDENNIPLRIENRLVRKQEEIIVKSREVEFFVWDKQKEDGDTVSLNINGSWVLERHGITHQKKSVRVTIKPGTNNYLILFANNLGKTPPNTAAISLHDGTVERELVLTSDMRSCGALNFILKVK